jgi:hypothetical protein
MTLPLWAVGLVLAAVAPLLVRVIADTLDARARKRTEALLGRDVKKS